MDSPFEERACRTKLTMKVNDPDRFLENWSCGLHRVVFNHHTRDLRWFLPVRRGIRICAKGRRTCGKCALVLEWETSVHA